MADGDIFELNVDAQYNLQNLTNVLHFAQVGTDGSGGARQALAQVWKDDYQVPHLALCVSSLSVIQIRIRKLFPTQTQQFIDAIGQGGAVMSDGLPPQQCAILDCSGVRGGPGGRRGAGHMKISGVPLAASDNGRINAAYGIQMQTLGDEFEGVHVDAGSGYTFESVILSTVDDIGRKVIRSGATSRIRTVYSRTIGVGQ